MCNSGNPIPLSAGRTFQNLYNLLGGREGFSILNKAPALVPKRVRLFFGFFHRLLSALASGHWATSANHLHGSTSQDASHQILHSRCVPAIHPNPFNNILKLDNHLLSWDQVLLNNSASDQGGAILNLQLRELRYKGI